MTLSVLTAAWAPDEQAIVSLTLDATVVVHPLAESASPIVLPGHDGSLASVEYDPTGRWLVSASDDKTAIIWSASGRKRLVLSGHQDAVMGATFSPLGDRVLTFSSDGTARVWSLDQQDDLLEGCARPRLIASRRDAERSCSGSPSTMRSADSASAREFMTRDDVEPLFAAWQFQPPTQLATDRASRVSSLRSSRCGNRPRSHSWQHRSGGSSALFPSVAPPNDATGHD